MPNRRWPSTPRRRAGRKPQFTSEDLPLPEVPTTARKRLAASLSTMVSTWLLTAKEEIFFLFAERS